MILYYKIIMLNNALFMHIFSINTTATTNNSIIIIIQNKINNNYLF